MTHREQFLRLAIITKLFVTHGVGQYRYQTCSAQLKENMIHSDYTHGSSHKGAGER